jgi:hypothetical protein
MLSPMRVVGERYNMVSDQFGFWTSSIVPGEGGHGMLQKLTFVLTSSFL